MRLKSVSTGRRLLSVLTLGAAMFALAGATLAQPAVAATGAAAKTAAPAPAPARSASRFAATIRDGRAAAKALLDLTKAPSLSLALVSNGRVVWQQGFGYADVATRTAPGPDTMYGIGSVSKMFATVAAMRLVDQGKLALDAPVAAYLPTFTMLTPGYRTVTVRMLLDHSSGFPGSSYEDSATGEYWPGYVGEVMDTLAHSRLKSTPGFLSVYCNDGFTLVEALVPAVTGESYAQFVQDEILTPLGMTHSAFPLAPFPDGSYAKAYTDGKADPREALNVLASGAAYSTPSDMSRLAMMFANGGAYGGARILSATSVTEMGKDQTARSFTPVDYEATRYGLGWDSVTQPGLKAVGVTAWMKGGDAIDYHAAIIVAPKQKLSAVVLGVTPLSSGALETLCERILLHALVDRGLLRRVPEPMAPGAPPAKTASAAQLAAIEGYWAGNGLVLRVHAPGSNPQVLDADMLGQTGWGPWFAGLRLRTDNGFHRKGNVNSLRTVTGAGRRYLVLRLASGTGFYFDDMPLAQKVRPGEPLSAAWQARVGHFWLAANERPQSGIYTASGGPVLGRRRRARPVGVRDREHLVVRAPDRGPQRERRRGAHVPADPGLWLA